jgi:hypothetical protein
MVERKEISRIGVELAELQAKEWKCSKIKNRFGIPKHSVFLTNQNFFVFVLLLVR